MYVQSEEKLYYYDGTTWQPISSNTNNATNGWELNGNSISNSDFIGTINNQDFRTRTNDTLRMIVKEDGKVGIGLENPTGIFQISNNTNSTNSTYEIYDLGFFYDYDLNEYEWETVIADVSNLSNLTLTHLSYGTTTFINIPPPTFDLSTANSTTLGVIVSDPTIVIDNIRTSYWFFAQDQYHTAPGNCITAIKIVFDLNGNELRARETESRRRPISFLAFSNQNDSYMLEDNWILDYLYDVDLVRVSATSVQTNNFIVATNGNIGIDTETPTEKLHVIGNILASGSITPDYVFETYFDGKSKLKPHYELRPLEENIEYAKKHKHLPGVSSAQEIKEQGGIILNRAVEQNLEKIEELYLYMHELQQEIKELKETKSTSTLE